MASRKRKQKYIEGVEKTKTYTYLFEPSTLMFHNESVKEVFDSYISGVKIINVFLGDTSVNKYSITDAVYHILCDFSGLHAMARLKQLKRSQYYLDTYIINRNPKIGVILFKAFKGKAYNNFLLSKYNAMYSDTLLDAVKSRFIKIAEKDDIEKEDYTHAYKVLSDNEDLRKYWAKKFQCPAEYVKQLEEKINLEKEIVNIPEYYDKIQSKI
jgi:hypothetical protein